MEDTSIVELFWSRSEEAIVHAQLKYGNYCRSIAYTILHSEQDAEECESDTFLHAWNSMPPNRPNSLSAFLAKITRNLSIDRLRAKNSQRRGGEYNVVLDEVAEILSSEDTPENELEDELDAELLTMYINHFLRTLPQKHRLIFVGRYWKMMSASQLADKFGTSESAVKALLHRTRKNLASYLKKEGYDI